MTKNQRHKIVILEFLDTLEEYPKDKYGNYLKYLSKDIRYKPKKKMFLEKNVKFIVNGLLFGLHTIKILVL